MSILCIIHTSFLNFDVFNTLIFYGFILVNDKNMYEFVYKREDVQEVQCDNYDRNNNYFEIIFSS